MNRGAALTIGMMARAPVPGHCKTRLARAIGEDAASRLYEAMLRDSLRNWGRAKARRKVLLAAPENDGLRVLQRLAPADWEVVSQEGADLGERLGTGFRVLEADTGPVVLVDSDSPTLPVAELAERLSSFGRGRRALFGPSEDGGYYLVGMGAWEPRLLENIRWSTSTVLQESLDRCRSLGMSWDLLPPWYDVDEAEDLVKLREELAVDARRAPACAEVLVGLGLLERGPT